MKNKSDFSWFELEKYDGLEVFDLEDWYYQFNKRLVIKKFGKESPELKEKISEPRFNDMHRRTKKHIESIKRNPFFHYQKKNKPVLSVRHADYFDLHLANYKNDSLKNFFNLQENEFLGETGKTLIIDQINSSSPFDRALTTINLGATDEQLKKDFDRWLKEQRVVSGFKSKEKRFTSKDIEKWIKNKILPYMDLSLIADCENIHLTQHKLGQMLFVDEYDVDLTERIRRTVKPIAESLLDINTIEALLIQVRAT